MNVSVIILKIFFRNIFLSILGIYISSSGDLQNIPGIPVLSEVMRGFPHDLLCQSDARSIYCQIVKPSHWCTTASSTSLNIY